MGALILIVGGYLFNRLIPTLPIQPSTTSPNSLGFEKKEVVLQEIAKEKKDEVLKNWYLNSYKQIYQDRIKIFTGKSENNCFMIRDLTITPSPVYYGETQHFFIAIETCPDFSVESLRGSLLNQAQSISITFYKIEEGKSFSVWRGDWDTVLLDLKHTFPRDEKTDSKDLNLKLKLEFAVSGETIKLEVPIQILFGGTS